MKITDRQIQDYTEGIERYLERHLDGLSIGDPVAWVCEHDDTDQQGTYQGRMLLSRRVKVRTSEGAPCLALAETMVRL